MQEGMAMIIGRPRSFKCMSNEIDINEIVGMQEYEI